MNYFISQEKAGPPQQKQAVQPGNFPDVLHRKAPLGSVLASHGGKGTHAGPLRAGQAQGTGHLQASYP